MIGMRKIKIATALFIVMMSLGSLFSMSSSHAAPSGQGQQIFFDDFTSSQFSPSWNPKMVALSCPSGNYGCVAGNLTQNGGWLTLSAQRGLIPSNCFGVSCILQNSIVANNIDPIISNKTKNQFLYMAWRTIPFNLTQVGNNPGSNANARDATAFFGLIDPNSQYLGNASGIGVELSEVDNIADSNFLMPNQQREAVALMINHPTSGFTSNCFSTYMYLLGPFGAHTCNTANRAITYTNANAPIDLNTVHTITMEINLAQDQTSWVAMRVDDNGWFNVTQRACTCLEGGPEGWLNLYPYAFNGYSVNNIGSKISNPPNQSLGTFVDYVLIDNYVPSSLPVGQTIPNSGVSSQIGPNGLTSTFPNYWVALAYDIGKGIPINPSQFLMSQIQFGGFILFLLTCVAFSIPGIIMKVRNHLIYDMIVFIAAIVNFTFGVLALWMFGALIAIFISILVGTVPATLRDHDGGGYVRE